LREELTQAADLLDMEAVQAVADKIKADLPHQAQILENAVANISF